MFSEMSDRALRFRVTKTSSIYECLARLASV